MTVLLAAALGLATGAAEANWVKPTAKQAATERGGLFTGFIENLGQWGSVAKFYSAMPGMDVWMTNRSIKYDFYRSTGMRVGADRILHREPERDGQVVELEFLGSNPNPTTQGLDPAEGTMNFIRRFGNFTGVKSYDEAKINSLYEGVDLRVYSDAGRPRFDLIVQPGHDPSQIRFRYAGTSAVKLVDGNTMSFSTRFGDVKVTDLFAYQVGASKEQVACSFVRHTDGSYGFQVGAHDPNKPLVIDPVVFSTLYGGFAPALTTLGDDLAFAVAVDSLNAVYSTGASNCPNFPITNGTYDNLVAGVDSFICKMNPNGSGLIYSTFIGGPSTDVALSIAVDSTRRPVIVGYTNCTGTTFPTTPGAPQEVYGGGTWDAFCVRLTNDGTALDFGTLLGGTSPNVLNPPGDIGYAVDLDAGDNMYIGGQAVMPNFPTTGGVLQTVFGGSLTDGFVARIGSTGFLDYATFLGGTGGEAVVDIDVNNVGEAHVTGGTSSPNFPLTAGSWDTSVQQQDAFVCKINPSGTAFEYSTVVGGSSNDAAAALSLDNQGNAYIVGSTTSVDFPRTAGCYDNLYNPDFENFVTKVAIDGRNLVYSTFLNSSYTPTAIGVDDTGVAVISGYGASIAVSTNADDPSYNGPPLYVYGDALIQALDEAGSSLLFGSYYGGQDDDGAFGLAVDRSRNVFVAGATNSYAGNGRVQFPTTTGAYKETMANDNPPSGPAFFDAFLMKLKVRTTPVVSTFTINPVGVAGTEVATATINLTGPASPGGAVIRLTSSNEAVAQCQDASGARLDLLVIPEGQSVGTFRVQTFDLVTSAAVQITAELEGDFKVASITVSPWLTNMTLSPNTVVGGNRVTGRVTLVRPAPAGMEVSISSSDTTKAYAIDASGAQISSFIVPTGNTTAVFDILTRGVNTTANVTLIAKITTPNLQVTRSQVLQIRPASLRSISFAPNRVDGGENTTGTVTLDGEAGPNPIKVDLTLGTTGNPPVNVTVPASVYVRRNVNDVEAGKFVNFTATAGVANANTYRNVIATRNNVAPIQTAQATLFVDNNDMVNVELSSNSVTGGTVVTGHVNLAKPAGAAGFTLLVTTNDTTFAPLAGGPSQQTFNVPTGAIRTTPDFQINTKMTAIPRTATISAIKTGYTTRTATLTIRPLDFTISAAPNPVVGGSRNAIGTVTLTDVAPTNADGGARIYLANSDTTACTFNPTVLVPQGTTTGTFTIFTKSVVVPKSVTITATLNTLPTPIVHTTTLVVNPLLIGINITPATVVGGNNATGTVSLSDIAGPNGLLVALSSNSTKAIVPSSVLVQSGQTQVNFTVRTLEVAATTVATITGNTPAGVTASATITILPLTLSLSLSPTTVRGGVQNSVATVTMSANAPRTLSLAYTSSNTAAATVSPSAGSIGIGTNSTTFNVLSRTVSVNTNVTITARLTATGVTASANLLVLAPTIVSLTLATNEIIGGDSTTGTVTISNPAPATGVVVNLYSNSTAVQVPATTTVPNGQTSRTFNITSSAVSVDLIVTLRAAFNGTSATATLAVLAPTLTSFTFTPSTVTGGNSATGRVSIDRPAGPSGVTITLTKNASSTGAPYVTVPTTVKIPAGATSVTFPVTTTTVSRSVACQVTATFAQRNQQVVATLTLLPQ